jgi:hypothetical protein
MTALSALLMSDWFGPTGAAIRAAVSPFDVAALYGSAAMLLTAMFNLFRMRKRSVWLLISYAGIGSWVALRYAVTAGDGFEFDALASLGGVVAILMILGYTISLRARGALA